jgi:hypothetical protein
MSRGIWITSKEAAEILSKNSGRAIKDQYVRDYARKGQIRWRPIDGRSNEYLKSDVEKLNIKKNKPQANRKTDLSPETIQLPLEDAA